MSWLFVHSTLDDAGLDPESFRVLAHIARRADGSGVAFPSIKSAAKTCRLNKDTVARRLRDLVAAGWLERITRPGLPTGFRITNSPEGIRSEGIPPIRQEGISDGEGYPSKQVSPIRREGSGVIRREGSEGNPNKVIHKGNPNKRARRFDAASVELPFSTTEFREAWQSFVQHRIEKRNALTPTAAKRQLAQLREIGENRAIIAIRHSVAQGWTGIFEPKSQREPARTAALRPNEQPKSWNPLTDNNRPQGSRYAAMLDAQIAAANGEEVQP